MFIQIPIDANASDVLNQARKVRSIKSKLDNCENKMNLFGRTQGEVVSGHTPFVFQLYRPKFSEE